MINEPEWSATHQAREAHLSVQGKASSFPEGFFFMSFLFIISFQKCFNAVMASLVETLFLSLVCGICVSGHSDGELTSAPAKADQ